ncbi:MAG: Efflux ABC transporter, ATP-binding protein [uncultured Chloroflexia bacterium]|uniref:Efflux ABC transporter, ATP-binding protein n=1 Tax=uncultured Chloroflexia bacterium TaxID=1672391 RepID=A0A6J4KAV1_9CHLR|nr:MAG: Efflux ABC transporter, ATP-binding protein [uncultured Chloroflexia bacterium]
MNAIETYDLTRHYRRTVALAGLNLAVEQGAIYGFIGPNGAGKTTTLRMLAGLLEPTSGQIQLLGRTLDHHGRAAQQLVGYMPDFFGVYDDLRVWEYLDFWARCHDLPAAKRRRTVDDLLDLVDLTPKRDAFVQSLSRGMQQRLGLAHTLVHDPPILLLDEPASGLDPRGRLELLELLRTLREMGKTIVLSSHILSELAEVCTVLGIIRSGTLVASGTLDEVRRTLGSTNRLRIRVQHDAPLALTIIRAFGGIEHVEIEPTTDSAGEPVPLLPEQPATLLVDWNGDDDRATALLAELVRGGVPIRSYADDGGDLEDLFLQLTAREEHA